MSAGAVDHTLQQQLTDVDDQSSGQLITDDLQDPSSPSPSVSTSLQIELKAEPGTRDPLEKNSSGDVPDATQAVEIMTVDNS